MTKLIKDDSLVKYTSLHDAKFQARQKHQNGFSYLDSWLSVASLGLMLYCNLFFVRKLSNPCSEVAMLQQQGDVGTELVLDRFGLASALEEPISFVYKVYQLSPNLLWWSIAQDNPACDEAAASWSLMAFQLTAVGSAFGLLMELSLLLLMRPFETQWTRLTSQLHNLRKANFALVLVTTTLVVVCLVVRETSLLSTVLLAFSFLAGALSIGGLFDTDPYLPLAVLLLLVAQVVLPLSLGTVVGGPATARLAAGSGLAQLLSLAAEPDTTPRASTVFHIISTTASYLLYLAVVIAADDDPAFHHRVENALYPSSSCWWWRSSLLAGVSFVLGALYFLRFSKTTYQAARSTLSFVLWTAIYGFVASDRILNSPPYKLSDVYEKTLPEQLTLVPFGRRKYLNKPLNVPSVARLPEPVAKHAKVVKTVMEGFDLITFLDSVFPQAVVDTPPKDKIRLEANEDGQALYPASIFGLMPTFPKEGRRLLKAPQVMVDRAKKGQLLEFLCQHSFGNSYLRLAKEKAEHPFYEEIPADEKSAPDGLVLDLSRLEKYQNQPGRHRYGGVAFFKFKPTDQDETCLKLSTEWVVEPMGSRKISASNGLFRAAEDKIVSSLLFDVVAGKHLAELHQAFNLLEYALHNEFDCALNKFQRLEGFNAHPLRVVLYVHMFSHALATELTVEHLLQKNGVFEQVFALTHESLVEYMEDKFYTFDFCSDEDWRYRTTCMAPLLSQAKNASVDGAVEPGFSCSLEWELRYKQHTDAYAQAAIGAMYDSDEDVKADAELAAFWKELCGLYASISDRYDELQTKDGLALFVSDIVFHLTVRHELYGTCAMAGAFDSRIMTPYVPEDGGTIALDEWRSFVYIGLVTAYPPFVSLMQDDTDNDCNNNTNHNNNASKQRRLECVFEDATPVGGKGNQMKLAETLRNGFLGLTDNLCRLQREWDSRDPSGEWKLLVPQPKALHSGPGY